MHAESEQVVTTPTVRSESGSSPVSSSGRGALSVAMRNDCINGALVYTYGAVEFPYSHLCPIEIDKSGTKYMAQFVQRKERPCLFYPLIKPTPKRLRFPGSGGCSTVYLGESQPLLKQFKAHLNYYHKNRRRLQRVAL